MTMTRRAEFELTINDKLVQADSDVERLWDQGGVPGWSAQKQVERDSSFLTGKF